MNEWIVCLNGWRGPDPLHKSWMPVTAHKLSFTNGHLVFLDLQDAIVRAIAPGHWAFVVTRAEFERTQAMAEQYALAS